MYRAHKIHERFEFFWYLPETKKIKVRHSKAKKHYVKAIVTKRTKTIIMLTPSRTSANRDTVHYVLQDKEDCAAINLLYRGVRAKTTQQTLMYQDEFCNCVGSVHVFWAQFIMNKKVR